MFGFCYNYCCLLLLRFDRREMSHDQKVSVAPSGNWRATHQGISAYFKSVLYLISLQPFPLGVNCIKLCAVNGSYVAAHFAPRLDNPTA